MAASGTTSMSAAAPPGGAALTWPKFARVSPKVAGATGEDDGPWLVKFPPSNAAGGVFALLQARSPRFSLSLSLSLS